MVYCSPSCERITGYKSEEFINNPMLLLNIIYPEDLKIFIRQKYMEAKAKEVNHGIQYRIITKNGDTRWISHECCPIYNVTGEFIGNRGSNKDITRRKKTEQLLRMSNQKYKLLSENISDGFLFIEIMNLSMSTKLYRIFWDMKKRTQWFKNNTFNFTWISFKGGNNSQQLESI